VHLAILVAADVYLSDEFASLEGHLMKIIGRTETGNDPLASFFQRANDPLAGMHWTNLATLTSAQIQGFAPIRHFEGLPQGVREVHVSLFGPSPGIAALTAFLVLDDAIDVVRELMETRHPRRVVETRESEQSFTVEATKRDLLAQRLASLIDFGLFPARRGLCGGAPYPSGVACVYGGTEVGVDDVPAMSTVLSVLGVDTLSMFHGMNGDTLFTGVPSSFGSERHVIAGLSLFVGREAWQASQDPHSGGLHARYSEWLTGLVPLAILCGSMDIFGQQATRVRRFLERFTVRWWNIWNGGRINGQVNQLDQLDYRLKRIRAFLKDYRPRGEITPMLSVRASQPTTPTPQFRSISDEPLRWLRRWFRSGRASDPSTPSVGRSSQPAVDFSTALRSMCQMLLGLAASDVKVSLGRAQHILDMRTNAALVRWATLTTAFTLIAATAAMLALLNH
jgi:hypothetical protein